MSRGHGNTEGRLRKGTHVRYELTDHETWRGDGLVLEGVVEAFVPDAEAFLTGEHYVVARDGGGHDTPWPCEIAEAFRRGRWEPADLTEEG